MSIYSTSAKWSNNQRSGTTCIDEETFLDTLNYLIDNIYFTFGNKCSDRQWVYKKGTDCAPFLANLFLY